MLDGILLVNKPQGWTSFDVCNFVKKRFGIKKVGHTGTLDPSATGLLILLLGKMTRLQNNLSSESKLYEGVIELGKKTDTQDSEGKVIQESMYDHVSADQIFDGVKQFTGKIQQVPPMFSAVKHEGRRLYALARQGKEVKRESREIEIFSFDILEVRLPEIKFLIHCSKGTYVRTIANDLGEALGTTAFLKKLERVQSGDFELSSAVSIEQLKAIESRDELRMYLHRYRRASCNVA